VKPNPPISSGAVRVLLVVAVLAGALLLRLDAAPPLEGDISGVMPAPVSDGRTTGSNRIMVVVRPAVTPTILDELSQYGQVHGWIDRLRIVSMTPTGNNRSVVRTLPFVETVETDRQRHLTDVGTWDRDLLDITDVEESGTIGAPDPREVAETGAGVHVAVIDTGLIENWRDFLVESRVDTSLARAFMGGGAVAEDFVPPNEFRTSNPTDMWERDTNSHGTAVASHIIGFKIRGSLVDGASPGVTLFPLKVFPNGEAFTWSSRIIAAIDYVTRLKESGAVGPTVISMSIGGSVPAGLEEQAINRAIAAGVILVFSAGNRGERGMGWPAAYPQSISAGAVGWSKQFRPGTVTSPNFGFWWTQDAGFDPDPGSGPAEESEAFIAGFSSRAIPSRGQQLDVVAPGQWTVAPGGHGPNAAFFFWAGTSFSTPLTAGTAALVLEANPSLRQADVERILKGTALRMAPADCRNDVLSGFDGVVGSVCWDDDCNGVSCDPVGAGLVQADGAVAAARR